MKHRTPTAFAACLLPLAFVLAGQSAVSVEAKVEQELYPVLMKFVADMAAGGSGVGGSWVEWKLHNRGEEPVRVTLRSAVVDWTSPTTKQVELRPHQDTTVGQGPFGAKLLGVTSTIPAGVELKAEIGGESVFEDTRSTRINSADDMVWSLAAPYDMAPLIAMWVTPKDELVEWQITQAKKKLSDHSFSGYSGDVSKQVKAIFNAVRDQGISYVNSTVNFCKIGHTQRVRLPKESIRTKSANCIDGAVLFASLFENIGLEPLVVLVPGHAFVGVRLSPGSPRTLFIETTMVGRNMMESILSGQTTYDAAVARANEEFSQAHAASLTDPTALNIVDISAARQKGIYPTW